MRECFFWLGKSAFEMRIGDWRSGVCSSVLLLKGGPAARKSRLWRHFRLPCPLGLIAVLSAWLFWQANCDGAAGAVAAMEAQRLNDPLSNNKRAAAAGLSWGCRVEGTLKPSGEAEGRTPTGRGPTTRRLCFFC